MCLDEVISALNEIRESLCGTGDEWGALSAENRRKCYALEYAVEMLEDTRI